MALQQFGKRQNGFARRTRCMMRPSVCISVSRLCPAADAIKTNRLDCRQFGDCMIYTCRVTINQYPEEKVFPVVGAIQTCGPMPGRA
jgi:hypothetical protein